MAGIERLGGDSERSEGWDFGDLEVETVQERSRETEGEFGKKILGAIGERLDDSAGDTESGATLEGSEEFDRNLDSEAVQELKAQWGKPSEGKAEYLLEFERKVDWEEFQKRAKEAWLAGQKGDSERMGYIIDWHYDVTPDDQYGFVADVYQSLRKFDVARRFGSADERMNFYGDMSVEGLKTALLEDKWQGNNDTPTQYQDGDWKASLYDMHLSHDRFDESGKLISGVDDERPGKDRAVTVVFDNKILESEESLDAGAKYPKTAVVGDLYKHIVALVAKNEDVYNELQDVKAIDGIPVFPLEDWTKNGEALAEKAQEGRIQRIDEHYEELERRRREEEEKEERQRREKERQRREEEERIRKEQEEGRARERERLEARRVREAELQKLTLDEVDEDAVKESVRGYAEKLDTNRLHEIYDQIRRDGELGAVSMVRYMAEVLELGEIPSVEYSDDMEDDTYGYCRRRSGGDLIRINQKYTRDVIEQMDTIAHECRHSYQHMISSATEGEEWQKIRELYDYNFKHYVSPDVDRSMYRKQLVEIDARAFAAVVREKMQEFVPLTEKMRWGALTKVGRVTRKIKQWIGAKNGREN